MSIPLSERDEASNGILALLPTFRIPQQRDETWIQDFCGYLETYRHYDPAFELPQPRNSLVAAVHTLHNKPHLFSDSDRDLLHIRLAPLYDVLVDWVVENPTKYGYLRPMLESLRYLPSIPSSSTGPVRPLSHSTVTPLPFQAPASPPARSPVASSFPLPSQVPTSPLAQPSVVTSGLPLSSSPTGPNTRSPVASLSPPSLSTLAGHVDTALPSRLTIRSDDLPALPLPHHSAQPQSLHSGRVLEEGEILETEDMDIALDDGLLDPNAMEVLQDDVAARDEDAPLGDDGQVAQDDANHLLTENGHSDNKEEDRRGGVAAAGATATGDVVLPEGKPFKGKGKQVMGNDDEDGGNDNNGGDDGDGDGGDGDGDNDNSHIDDGANDDGDGDDGDNVNGVDSRSKCDEVDDADPQSKKRKLPVRKSSTTKDRIFKGMERCDGCRTRGEEFCRVPYRADKPMVCTACRNDRSKCSKSVPAESDSEAAAPSEPPATNTVSAPKPFARPLKMEVYIDKSPPRLRRPSVKAQEALPAKVAPDTDTPIASSSKLAHLHARLFDLELHEERCRMRMESERSNLARSQACLFSEEVALAQVEASIAEIEAALAAKGLTQPVQPVQPAQPIQPVADAPAKPARGRKNGRGSARRK